MTLYFENEYAQSLPLPAREVAQQVVRAALSYVDCPYETQVNLLVTDDPSIWQMNLDNRGIDAATDVLSFPMLEFSAPGDFSFLQEDFADGSVFDPDSGELLLGDIVISMDHVTEQAARYGHSITREFAFLVAHSMLHLMGYDHMTKQDAAQMEAHQERILQGLGITRA